MDTGFFAVIILALVASGCIGGGSDSVVSSYGSQVVKIEDIDQDTAFTIDKASEEYQIDTTSPDNSIEFFSNTENKKMTLRGVCKNLQQMMDSDPNTDALGLETVNIRNGEGEMIENSTIIESDELASTIEKYELSNIHYTVKDKKGSVTAECEITGRKSSDLNMTIY